jgi:hypothetical protein
VYNQIFTMHGTTMVFLVGMPIAVALFNYLVPLQIGARDVAFPRLNALSYWIFLFGAIFMNFSFLLGAAPNGGWFGYAPLTSTQYSPGLNIDFWALGLQALGAASIMGGVNFITTIIKLRAPGMRLMRMPLFTWMAFITSFLIITALPVLAVALFLVTFDRFWGTNFFVTQAGGDPMLWQHLFWMFGHPEVYILILPAFGIVSRSSRRSREAAVRLRGHGVLGRADRPDRLGRVGAPHVRDRHGPHRRRVLHGVHHDHRDPDGREDLQLDRDDVGRQDPLHDGDDVRHRHADHVHDRRRLRRDARHVAAQPAADGHVLRGGALPLRADRRADLLGIFGTLLLVPEDDGPDDERTARASGSSGSSHRLQPDVHADALDRAARHAAPHLHVLLRAEPRRAELLATSAASCTAVGVLVLCYNLVCSCGAVSRRAEPVGRSDAGVGDRVAAGEHNFNRIPTVH